MKKITTIITSVLGFVTLSIAGSLAGDRAAIFLDSSGSIAAIPGGGGYVLSIGDKIVERLKERGIEADVYSFDDNVERISSKDEYFVNKNGSTDFKGVAEKLKNLNASIAIIVSDGKVPKNYTETYVNDTIKEFSELRENGLKVCFASIYKDILPFPSEISDVVESSDKVDELIKKCIPIENPQVSGDKDKKKSSNTGVQTSDVKKSSDSVIDPFSFVKEIKAKETVKNKQVDGGVTINIYQK